MRKPQLVLIGLLLTAALMGCRPATTATPTSQPLHVVTDNAILAGRVAGPAGAETLLIALHDGPGRSSDTLRELETLQSDTLAVATYDQRGSGDSVGPTRGYRLLDHVDDLEAVRATTGREQVILLGHGWGGVLALRYASQYPERVSALILVNSHAPTSDGMAAGQANLVQRMVALREAGVLPGELPDCEKEQARLLLPAYFSDPNWEIPAVLDQMSYIPHIYRYTMQETGAWDFAADLDRLTLPVLFIWGEDNPFGWEMAQATLDALPAASIETVVLEECGHYWQECPKPFYAALRRFLNEQAGD
jgi:pimeloyl-ACP methyl ester carboxylesterase